MSFIRCDSVLAAPSWSVHSKNYLKVVAKYVAVICYLCIFRFSVLIIWNCILPYLFLSRSSEKVMFPKYQTCTVDLMVTQDIFLVQINLSFWPTLNQQSTKLILLLKTSAGLKSFKIAAIILICDQTSIIIITSVIKMIILITINNVTTITYHHHHDHHFCKELGKRNAMWNIPAHQKAGQSPPTKGLDQLLCLNNCLPSIILSINFIGTMLTL